MSIFTTVWAAIKKFFSGGLQDIAKLAVLITEAYKTAMNDGIVGFIAGILDGLTNSKVPTEIIAIVDNNIAKILAVELAIEGLPTNPSGADILAFEQRVLAAFSVSSNKSKIYTVLAAQIYQLVQNQVNADAGKNVTFAQIVLIIEKSYTDYLQDTQDSSTD